jgi:hypothetical protein
MTYVLMLLVGGFVHSSPLAMTSTEFHSKAACEAAGVGAVAAFQPIVGRQALFFCAEKGLRHDR